MEIKIVRTTPDNSDFEALVKELDLELAVTDGEDHAFYNQFNLLDSIKHVIVVYHKDKPVGCGAIKKYDETNMEVKRMFVLKSARGKGIAVELLNTLETWTKELGFKKCILETGVRQKSAIRLYEKNGYSRMTNYGQYSGVKDSVCFVKTL